jgi:hypothetical protein
LPKQLLLATVVVPKHFVNVVQFRIIGQFWSITWPTCTHTVTEPVTLTLCRHQHRSEHGCSVGSSMVPDHSCYNNFDIW